MTSMATVSRAEERAAASADGILASQHADPARVGRASQGEQIVEVFTSCISYDMQKTYDSEYLPVSYVKQVSCLRKSACNYRANVVTLRARTMPTPGHRCKAPA